MWWQKVYCDTTESHTFCTHTAYIDLGPSKENSNNRNEQQMHFEGKKKCVADTEKKID